MAIPKKLPKNRFPDQDLNELFLGIRDKLTPDEINRNRKMMGLPSQSQAPKKIGDIKKSVDALIDRIEKSKSPEQYMLEAEKNKEKMLKPYREKARKAGLLPKNEKTADDFKK